MVTETYFKTIKKIKVPDGLQCLIVLHKLVDFKCLNKITQYLNLI